MSVLNEFYVLLGYKCNFNCNHCGTLSSPNRSEKLEDSELISVCKTVNQYSPKKLGFTGGETTLYIDDINRIIAAHPDPQKVHVQITSNGWYGRDHESTQKVLQRIKKIDNLQISYDFYHDSSLSEAYILNIINFCKAHSIEINLSICITSPIELAEATDKLEKFKSLEIPIVFQKIVSTGRALQNKLQYHFPVFENEVLQEKCPNLGQVVYIAGKGYTTCCSNLIFNPQNRKGYTHKSVDEHQDSQFFKLISTFTFKNLLDQSNHNEENLLPIHSSPCNLCEYLFSDRGGLSI